MTRAFKLDRETAVSGCRFVIRSEAESEAIEPAKRHMRDVHGRDYTGEELRGEHLKLVCGT